MSVNAALLFATSVASFLLAFFVYSKGQDKVVNRTLAWFSVALAIWTFGQAAGEVAWQKEAVLIWTRINIGAAVWLPVFYIHFIGALLKLKNKSILFVAYFFALVLTGLVVTPLFVRDVAPVAGYRYYPQAGIVYPVFAVYLFSCFLYSFTQLVLVLRRASGEEYKRLLYVFAASLIGFLGGVTTFFPIFSINLPVISHFTLPIYVALAVYAIVVHKLLDITVYVRRGLVYSSLTISFAAFYALIILLTDRFFQKLAYFNESLVMIIVVAASVVVFQPLRDWVQQIVDRLFFRGSYYYEKTIDDLSSENKKLYQTLLRADKLAALGVMAAGMAHEIKNPLAAIKGMTQILPENVKDQEFIKEYADMIPRQLDRINAIVENLLKAGKDHKLEKKEVNISNILTDVLSFNRKVFEKQGINVITKFVEMPSVSADPEQIYQVFSNLVLNATDAMAAGGNLTVEAGSYENKVFISIADAGSGIPEDKIDKIFDPFFSLKEKGTGLGLFTAYRIIQEHGGKIEVESKTGKGTTFTIWLYTKPKE